jgi:hypothetical protein
MGERGNVSNEKRGLTGKSGSLMGKIEVKRLHDAKETDKGTR